MGEFFLPIKQTLLLPGLRTRWHCTALQKNHHKSIQGFTLVEVLLAGLITVMTMTAVARFSVSAIAGSHNKAIRSNIEAEILDNMERIQQKDSQLTWRAIKEAGEENEACNGQVIAGSNSTNTGQSTYLGLKLNDESSPYFVSKPKTFGNKINLQRKIITGLNTSNTATALIIFRFNMPDAMLDEEQRALMEISRNEGNENNLYPNEEQRVLELNPNYAPHCFQL